MCICLVVDKFVQALIFSPLTTLSPPSHPHEMKRERKCTYNLTEKLKDYRCSGESPKTRRKIKALKHSRFVEIELIED